MWADDLRFAQQAQKAVKVRLLSGSEYLAGVYEVYETEGHASLLTPQTFGDETTRTRIHLDDIAELSVTDIEWK